MSKRRRSPLERARVYQDDAVELYLGDAFELVPRLVAAGVRAHVMLTDPPFSEHTHANAKRGRVNNRRAGIVGNVAEDLEPGLLVTFPSFTVVDVARLLDGAAELEASWFVANMDWRHAAALEVDASLRSGWSFIRLGAWVKENPTPSFTGDRPGQGWEGIAFLHRTGAGPLEWNGGGAVGVFQGPRCYDASYPTEKPLWLARELVRLFTDPGDLIVDPCCGSGSFVRAAKDLGRRAIGIDINPEAVAIAARRMAQGALPLFGGN